MALPRVLCLLPVRNGERDLPDWFASVEIFADEVIALDDGSTDATRAYLDTHPLVTELLINPVRESYVGWDDAGNRNRLLQAASTHDPTWIMSLDADERIPAEDAKALRQFLMTDALPGFAYGFEVFRAVEDPSLDGQWYDPQGLWIYRLFSHAPGQRFPDRRLHFVPIPTSIPRNRWMRTNVRIRHVGGATPVRRAHRYAKYEEADPELEFQDSYENLLAEPSAIQPWTTRPPDLPVLVADGGPETEIDLEAPVLSAVVISRNDEATIAESVQALIDQEVDQPFEIIVVTSGTDRTADIVREQFPSVRLVVIDHPALPGEARNAGWRLARGDYVTFPGSHVVVAPGSLQARLNAHEAGWPMVTGTTLNGNPTTAGWAAYFLDHSTVLAGRPSSELTGPPAHCSYMRHHLELVGGFPEDMRAGEDTVVNTALWERGLKAFRAQDAAIFHVSRPQTIAAMCRHHFGRGRAWGRIILERNGGEPALFQRKAKAFWRYGRSRMDRTDANVERWGQELRDTYAKHRRVVRLGIAASAAGMWFELLRPQPGKGRVLFGRSPRTTPAQRELPRGGTRLFPEHRIVADYGSPATPRLGILGRGDVVEAANRIEERAEQFASGGRSVLPAMDAVVTMATSEPGPMGTYVKVATEEAVEEYLDEARLRQMLFIADIQPGRSDFLTECKRWEHLLSEPDVGVALDPEWRIHGDQTPGDEVGSVDVAEVNAVIEYLGSLVRRHRLPQKLLMIHLFSNEMIGPGTIAQLPEVAVIFHFDGVGEVGAKLDGYAATQQASRPVRGIKVFLDQDERELSPEELLDLSPVPDVVTYQ